MTKLEHLTHFRGPAGSSTSPGGITVGLRPGGLFETVMTTTITFAELADGRTEVVTHQANVPAAYRSPGAQQGFRTSLDRCAAYVASLTRKK